MRLVRIKKYPFLEKKRIDFERKMGKNGEEQLRNE